MNINYVNQGCAVQPEHKNITDYLQNIAYSLAEIDNITEVILTKIDGGNKTNGEKQNEPCCISEKLESLKTRAEKIYHRLDQINNYI
jgi:hypothetical protein